MKRKSAGIKFARFMASATARRLLTENGYLP